MCSALILTDYNTDPIPVIGMHCLTSRSRFDLNSECDIVVFTPNINFLFFPPRITDIITCHFFQILQMEHIHWLVYSLLEFTTKLHDTLKIL